MRLQVNEQMTHISFGCQMALDFFGIDGCLCSSPVPAPSLQLIITWLENGFGFKTADESRINKQSRLIE